MPDRIYRVEQLSEPIRRAWASTNTCNVLPDCSEPPTHKVWIRQSARPFASRAQLTQSGLQKSTVSRSKSQSRRKRGISDEGINIACRSSDRDKSPL